MDLYLKMLSGKDVTQGYVDWFSEKEVVRFSDNQFRSFTVRGQIQYVEECRSNKDMVLFGIFDGNIHVGNISINGIRSPHRRAEITYVVGNSSYWGKGIASYAISEVIIISAQEYNLNKLVAGVAEHNTASARVLNKNGFVLEGIRKKHLFFDGKFTNQLDYGLLLNEKP